MHIANTIKFLLIIYILAAAQTVPDSSDDPLKRVGKPFAGLVNDVRRKYPHYKSDFIDGFKNFKCFVTFIFVYFATIAPCVTYGGLLSKKTEGWLGLSESIMATALGGILFGFFSGQPLMIVGVTGPVLLFEENIYSVSTIVLFFLLSVCVPCRI